MPHALTPSKKLSVSEWPKSRADMIPAAQSSSQSALGTEWKEANGQAHSVRSGMLRLSVPPSLASKARACTQLPPLHLPPAAVTQGTHL